VSAARHGLKLHLGCGSTVVPGWENLDKSPSIVFGRVPGLRRTLAAAGILTAEQAAARFPAGIRRVDVRRGLPYADGSARYVYSSHMIEHLAPWQARALLQECLRVLEPGGLLRLATPDLAAVVESYREGVSNDGESAADTFMAGFGHFVEQPGPRLATVLRRLFTAPHQWLYDEESLTRLLRESGFVDVMRRGFRESELPDIELLEDREGSLFVEARRMISAPTTPALPSDEGRRAPAA
jgi:predicted SAM-dependent methyltransferase